MSVRRNARLRRDYLYRKSLEATERLVYDRKRQLKEAIACAYLPSSINISSCAPPVLHMMISFFARQSELV